MYRWGQWVCTQASPLAGKRHRRRVVLLSRQQVGAAAVRHAGQAPVQRLEHVHGSNPRNQRQHRWQPRRTRGAAPRFPKQPENPPRTDSWRCAAGAVHVLLPGRNLRRAFYQEHARRGGRLCVGAASRSPASHRGVAGFSSPFFLSFDPQPPFPCAHAHCIPCRLACTAGCARISDCSCYLLVGAKHVLLCRIIVFPPFFFFLGL